MGQKQSEICPVYMKSVQVTQEIERRFIISPHPLYTNREEFKLLHEKLTNKKFMLRIMTADESQKKAIQAKILRRVAFKNSTLTKLQHYIFQKMESYCAKQFKIYLFFVLEPSTTLREEILLQGTSQPLFTQEEVIEGFQNLISGLLWVRYIKERHGNINTNHIYCGNHKMILSDPLLCPQSHQFPEKYPSPEKLKEMNNRIEQYNYYQSDIFSIALCMLQIIPNVKLDAIYKRNYTLNQKNLREEIDKCFKYPRLKTILESLLLDSDNLQNRKRYLEIYSNKCTFLVKDATQSSSASEKTVKIHTLGRQKKHQSKPKLNNTQENRRNKFAHFNQIANVQMQINGRDMPQIDTKFLTQNQSRKTLTSGPISNEVPYTLNSPIFNNELKTNNLQTPNFTKKVVFNYSPQNEYRPLTSFNELKTVNSRSYFPHNQPSNYQLPHHLYQFNTSPYNPRPLRIERIDTTATNPTNQGFSRSNSDFSIKSQLIVYEPNKSTFNVADLISPRQQVPEGIDKPYNIEPTNLNTNHFSYKPQSSIRYEYSNPILYKLDHENDSNVLNSINKFGQAATSFGFLENEKLPNNQGQSYVLQVQKADLQQQTQKKHPSDHIKQNISQSQISQLQNLPLKLSILVKNNIPESSTLDMQRQNNQQGTRQSERQGSLTKTPQRAYIHPTQLVNRTIPEEDHEEQQSFQAAQKVKKSQYKIEEYENGGRYEGFFLNGMRNGYGTFYYKEGGFYQGQWKNNLMNGYGKLYYDNQRIAYEGQWYNDEFHGKGRVYNDNWEQPQGDVDYSSFENVQLYWVQYDGQLQHDVKQGLGRWKFSNGQYYEGQFRDDFPDGKGVFYAHKPIKGVWSKGKLQKVLQLK